MRKFLVLCAVLAITVAGTTGTTTANAAEGIKLESRDWSFNGITGTYDRPALRRGLQVYLDVCANCHSLNLVSYRHLTGVGFTAEEIKAIAATFEVEDGPNGEGEMFSRPARPAAAPAEPPCTRLGQPCTCRYYPKRSSHGFER